MANRSSRLTAKAQSGWEIKTGKEIRNWKAHENYVFRLLLTADHRRLVSFGDAVVKVWDAATGRELQTLSMPRTAGASSISSMIAVSDNGRLIAASGIELDPKQKLIGDTHGRLGRKDGSKTLLSVGT